MAAPPAVKLRSATVLDRERLYDIHREALGPYIEQTWGWDEDWQDENFRKTYDITGLSVIQCDGREVGFMQVSRARDATVLQNIEIEPAYQGRGIGTMLVRALVEDARRHGIGVLSPCVNRSEEKFRVVGDDAIASRVVKLRRQAPRVGGVAHRPFARGPARVDALQDRLHGVFQENH